MVRLEQVLQVIYEVIDEQNAISPGDQRLDKSVDAALLGKSGKLDSIALVMLIVATEEKLNEVFDRTITLADEAAMSMSKSPFRTVGTLAEYAHSLLADGQ